MEGMELQSVDDVAILPEDPDEFIIGKLRRGFQPYGNADLIGISARKSNRIQEGLVLRLLQF